MYLFISLVSISSEQQQQQKKPQKRPFPFCVSCCLCFISKALGSFIRQASALELESRSLAPNPIHNLARYILPLLSWQPLNKTYFKPIRTCTLALPIIPGTIKKLCTTFRNPLSRRWYGKEIKTFIIKTFSQPSQFLHFQHLSQFKDIFILKLFQLSALLSSRILFPHESRWWLLQTINVSRGFTEKTFPKVFCPEKRFKLSAPS